MEETTNSSALVMDQQSTAADFRLGLIAALLAAISFGSYGVPMKGEAATRVHVDPLVFQTYKAFTVFVSIRCCFVNILQLQMDQ